MEWMSQAEKAQCYEFTKAKKKITSMVIFKCHCCYITKEKKNILKLSYDNRFPSVVYIPGLQVSYTPHPHLPCLDQSVDLEINVFADCFLELNCFVNR